MVDVSVTFAGMCGKYFSPVFSMIPVWNFDSQSKRPKQNISKIIT